MAERPRAPCRFRTVSRAGLYGQARHDQCSVGKPCRSGGWHGSPTKGVAAGPVLSAKRGCSLLFTADPRSARPAPGESAVRVPRTGCLPVIGEPVAQAAPSVGHADRCPHSVRFGLRPTAVGPGHGAAGAVARKRAAAAEATTHATRATAAANKAEAASFAVNAVAEQGRD